ncbi:alpha/beta hydrolase [Paenibacillus sonchi]|uniref:Alpha/beta hydrolase n=1 Tax=Paenibacillus sonchi TaxID=373687 RepID=A0A974SCU2_9BACL|nr:alpha/beta hydrolase [Paenibacillus sonchi]QQZ61227.1 alpha/beta hydrolase [Paenibacillus sonchi]
MDKSNDNVQLENKGTISEMRNKKPKKRNKVLKIMGISLLTLALIFSGMFLYVRSHPGIIIGFIQDALYKGNPINSFEPFNPPGKIVKSNGILYVNDIKYADEYPNSYVDISYPNTDTTIKRPTIVFFHGGGYFGGDKAMGDPMAVNDDANMLFNKLVENGYNLVNVNYALVPDYKFPVPVIQMNQAINFLVDNSEKYNLDMENVVVMGSSAGAILASQYGAIISNKDYADSFNIHPLLTTKEVKALVIDDAPIKTDELNFATRVIIGNYLGIGTNEFKSSKVADQYNAILHVTGDYPPSFINAANGDGFPKDMKALSDKLTSYQIDNDYFYLDKAHGKIAHGYLANIRTDKNAQEGFGRLVKFIDKYTKGSSAE